MSATWLIAHGDDHLSAAQRQAVAELFTRRLAGEPVAYIVGTREFYGLPFRVNAAVLIPRPETELLVDYLVQTLPAQARVADIGTGSGAIAVALAYRRPDVSLVASDISASALECAKENAGLNGVLERIDFVQADVLSDVVGPSFAEPRFQAIASNPPYIAAGDPHLSQGDLRFEPPSALSDGADGLQILRKLIEQAPAHLAHHGLLLMEHGFDQGLKVRTLLQASAHYERIQTLRDLAGCERMSLARLK